MDRIALAIVAQLVAWTFLAIAVLPGRGVFLYDEAYFYHRAIAFAQEGFWLPLGPYISGSSPVAYTPGGGLYAALAAPFLIFSDPRAGTIWLILLSSLAIYFFDRTLRFRGTPPLQRFCIAAVLIWMTRHAQYNDRIWNVNLYPALSLGLLTLALELARAREPRVRLWLCALAGLGAALALQVHLGGLLVVAICVFGVGFRAEHRLKPREILLAVAVGALAYVPYFAWEIAHGFENLSRLRGGTGSDFLVSDKAIWATLFAPFFYVSHFPTQKGFWYQPGSYSTWLEYGVCLASLAVGVVMTGLGLTRSNPLRWVGRAAWVAGVGFFLLNRRHFQDHYIASLFPLFALAAGTGFYHSARVLPRATMVALALYCVSATSVWINRAYSIDPAVSLRTRMPEIETLVALGTEVSMPTSEESFIAWVLARGAFQQELRFRIPGQSHSCQISLGHADGLGMVAIPPDAVARCAP